MPFLRICCIALLLPACAAPEARKPEPPPASLLPPGTVHTPPPPTHSKEELDGVLGLVSFSSDSALRILNADGSLWRECRFEEWSSCDSMRPFSLHPDYYRLVFKCTGKAGSRYRVIVDEDFRVEKWISRQPGVRFKPWEIYLLESSPETDLASNPVRTAPSDSASLAPISIRVPNFQPQRVSGDWMRVKWKEEVDYTEVWRHGWIRWRKDGRLTVRFTLFCMGGDLPAVMQLADAPAWPHPRCSCPPSASHLPWLHTPC
jgi:hypothetical protein